MSEIFVVVVFVEPNTLGVVDVVVPPTGFAVVVVNALLKGFGGTGAVLGVGAGALLLNIFVVGGGEVFGAGAVTKFGVVPVFDVNMLCVCDVGFMLPNIFVVSIFTEAISGFDSELFPSEFG